MTADQLPDDPDVLKAMVLARDVENARLTQIIKELQRHRFGRRAESLPEDQLLLGLEEAEQIEAPGEEEVERADLAKRRERATKRRTNRGSLPVHLPRIEMVVDIEDQNCPCCRNELHRIGEDVSERLDIVPAQLRVIVVRRPKYACRACEDVVVQVPAPARLIEGGLPTEATVAQVLVSKYADHLPLYRQAQIYARQGINLDRSTLADWVGRAAWHLRPVHERLLEKLKASPKLFADETTAPVLDPGRGKTKTGQLWAYARDDRPWQGSDPPGVAYVYAPGLTRFIDNGRIEIDSNTVERSIRPIALNRKNALFAGSDGGAEHWAVVASLIETCKLNHVEPLGYLDDVLTRIVNGHSNSQIDDLLPWAYLAAPGLKAVA
jgi:transposase